MRLFSILNLVKSLNKSILAASEEPLGPVQQAVLEGPVQAPMRMLTPSQRQRRKSARQRQQAARKRNRK